MKIPTEPRGCRVFSFIKLIEKRRGEVPLTRTLSVGAASPPRRTLYEAYKTIVRSEDCYSYISRQALLEARRCRPHTPHLLAFPYPRGYLLFFFPRSLRLRPLTFFSRRLRLFYTFSGRLLPNLRPL